MLQKGQEPDQLLLISTFTYFSCPVLLNPLQDQQRETMWIKQCIWIFLLVVLSSLLNALWLMQLDQLCIPIKNLVITGCFDLPPFLRLLPMGDRRYFLCTMPHLQRCPRGSSKTCFGTCENSTFLLLFKAAKWKFSITCRDRFCFLLKY